MLKTEKKILLWIEKNMLFLMALLAAAVGLYLRRAVIWWASPDASFYFDGHADNIQSASYYLLVHLFQYLPMLPLHSMKWFAGAADYVVAVLCIAAAGEGVKSEKLKRAFCLTVCILSPVVYLRGSCWAQIDSAAFAFLLGGYILWRKEKKAAAAALAATGTALYPCLLLAVLWWWLCGKEERTGRDWIYLGIMAAGVCALQGISGLLTGRSWTDSILSCIRWTTYDPYTGTLYKDPLLWVKQMVNLFGYTAAMVSGIAAYRHKVSYVVPLLVHLAVLLVYGSLLFPVAA